MPAQDFLAGRMAPRALSASCQAAYADLAGLLPQGVAERIGSALSHFNDRMPGFAGPEALLLGPETRGSSPVRMERDRATGLALGQTLVFPAGEGAGYAGGIVSAAADGLGAALRLIKAFGIPG
jgi:uncharacterized FAD-dependent dehydrogenase